MRDIIFIVAEDEISMGRWWRREEDSSGAEMEDA